MRGAVFLSYASQDADAARLICTSLRSGGVEVWFDQEGGLEHGDAWDAKIRGQIKDCVLFIPLISASTQSRLEGYFRIEWELAAERAMGIAQGVPFILPVVIDETRESEALVPDRFRKVQWTRLPGGVMSPEAVGRFLKLWSHRTGALSSEAASGTVPGRAPVARSGRSSRAKLYGSIAAAVVIALALALGWRRLRPGIAALTPAAASASAPAAPFSAARQMAERARAMSLDHYNSNADDFAAAESLIKHALELDPNDPEIWAISSQFNTAIVTRGFDHSPWRSEAARSQAEKAIKLDPESVEALFALGRWQRDHDPDPTVAEKTFEAVLKRAPGHFGAIGNLGTLYDNAGKLEDAIAMDERFAQQPAHFALARYEEYLAYFHRSYFADAERCVRDSIAVAPTTNSETGLAMVLVTARGDTPGAIKALAGIPASDRSEHRAIWISAYVHLLAREPEEALKDLSRLSADFIQDNWFSGPKAYWVGRAQLEAGRPAAARIAFEAGLAVVDARLKQDSENLDLRIGRANLLAWLGRGEEAMSEARTVDELRPDNYYWFASPVLVYAVLGRMDDALPLLRKLANPAPGQRVGWPLTPALLKLDPLWDKLRGDPQFAALIAAR